MQAKCPPLVEEISPLPGKKSASPLSLQRNVDEAPKVNIAFCNRIFYPKLDLESRTAEKSKTAPAPSSLAFR